jgi:hypothetical protein
MAFIILRRSRNSKGYYLVESYRDHLGRTRKRTLCYLGRERDGTDTLAKALAFWRQIGRRIARELRTATGPRRDVLRRRGDATAARIALLKHHLKLAAIVEAEKRRQGERAALMAEQAAHWHAIDRLRRTPSDEHARAAKRAFRLLALQLHPDQGGTHEEFVRLKDAYDRAYAAWKQTA